ncbi:MAG TPA: glycosyltransferase N-terminal domain-containing protein [Bacteroidia bacterium]|jgi:3-deoxy-D-manno-octulosonic-acid transferase|nr:glycosyltransferase N-terminal domain-containing protein [Bacteroidia bacterium]
MRALYSLNIFFYGILIRIASPFNAKAKAWLQGRKNWEEELRKKFPGNTSKVVWFHCASLGEFEQGRPVMERFRKENPEWKILLTFFSPSGYEVRRNYPGADFICYLPLDTKRNAKKFVEIVSPSLIYFVKYEFWLNFLAEFRKKKIPHILFSAIFREDQIFFKGHGKIFRDALKGFEMIFTQEENSVKLLSSIGVKSIAAGDTRFDRVSEIAADAKEIPLAKIFSGDEKKVIVAGSTWPSDEEKLFPAMEELFRSDWKLIIAPHELGESHISSIEKALQQNGLNTEQIVRYSTATEQTVSSKKALIIDNIGMLSSLYRYGKIAYVGGGFGKSIHNILEAAVYGMPVIFGPAHEKFNEAKEMIRLKSGFPVKNETELKNSLRDLTSNEVQLKFFSLRSLEFVKQNCGATEKILGASSSAINR